MKTWGRVAVRVGVSVGPRWEFWSDCWQPWASGWVWLRAEWTVESVWPWVLYPARLDHELGSIRTRLAAGEAERVLPEVVTPNYMFRCR